MAPKTTQPPPPAAPGDLIDFYLRWPEFRMIAERLATKRVLSAQERQIMRWLVATMDRISVRDIE